MSVATNEPGGPHLLPTALAADDAELCGIPAAGDGSKRPEGKWERWQHERPSRDQLETWFADGQRQGIGLVCGAISGDLEMFEFEGRARKLYTEFAWAASAAGLDELVERIRSGYEEQTPSGGIHWLYRCEQIAGNLKLARRPGPDPNPVEVLIETRGEGGFVIVAPSGGTTHPTGRPWVLSSGGFDTITTITADERAELHRVARLFDEMPRRDHKAAVS